MSTSTQPITRFSLFHGKKTPAATTQQLHQE